MVLRFVKTTVNGQQTTDFGSISLKKTQNFKISKSQNWLNRKKKLRIVGELKKILQSL